MSDDESIFLGLARAYSLSEVLPLDDARIALLFDEVKREIRGRERPLEVRVEEREGWIVSVGDGDGWRPVDAIPAGELARDLGGVGVDRVRLLPEVSGEELRTFLVCVREATIAEDPVGAAGALDREVDGLEIRRSEGKARPPGGAAEVASLFEHSDSERPGPESPEATPSQRSDSERPGPESPEATPAETGALSFPEMVAQFLEAEGPEREEVASRIRARADELRTEKAREGLVEGLEILVAEAEERPEEREEVLQFARELVDAGVAARIVVALREIRDEDERRARIELIAALGGKTLAPVLLEALTQTTDRAARRAYSDAMVALGAEGLDEVEAMLSDPRWFVARNGVAILGEIGGDRAPALLTSALGHDDPRVRREAVMALARTGGENAGILLQGMIDDPDADVRGAVAMALGVLRVERSLRPLLDRLEEEDDEDVLVQILRTLGQLGDPGAVSAIEKRAVTSFFSRPPRSVRIAAYRALSDIGTPHALQLLEAASEDRDPEVRAAVEEIRRKREE